MIKVAFFRTGWPNKYNFKYKGAFTKSFSSLSDFAKFFAETNNLKWRLGVIDIDPPLTKETQRILLNKISSIRKKRLQLNF